MRKILVIDDDDSLRKAMVCVLEMNGFKALEARNATDGTMLAQRQLPSLILCDLNLEKADGMALLAELRKNPITADIPFILMTGQAVPSDHAAESEFGGEQWLAKPFAATDLLAAIHGRLKQEKSHPPAPSRRIKASRQQLGALSGRLHSILEKERSRLARVIHDDLIQNLTVLALELSLLNSTLKDPAEAMPPERCRERVTELSLLVQGLIQSAQRITAELRPKVLDEFGLIDALEWLAEQFQKSNGINCELRVACPDVILDASVATEIYRLTQEILSNVVQHANASVVVLSIEMSAGHLRLEVRDNGKGITARQISNPESLGLLALRERTEALGGEFSIAGRLDQGTTVVARIPVPSQLPG